MILSVADNKIQKLSDQWRAVCACGKASGFASKSAALKMIARGSCRNCKRDYRAVTGINSRVYKRPDGRWCSFCSGCGNEQAYTRKDHARQSEVADWQCKQCVALAKGFSENKPVGPRRRIFNRCRKSALSRGIAWQLTIEEVFAVYTGQCALTGWTISIEGGHATASLDRIDSARGYLPGNIQWVHAMVNMCKNKYTQRDFVDMCHAVAATATHALPKIA